MGAPRVWGVQLPDLRINHEFFAAICFSRGPGLIRMFRDQIGLWIFKKLLAPGHEAPVRPLRNLVITIHNRVVPHFGDHWTNA